MYCIIYKLINKVNGKFYVGQTWVSLKERFHNGHGYRSCTFLQRAINKYGKEKFFYEVLTFCCTQSVADYWEDFFIKKYNSTDHKIGYNIRAGGSRGKLSDESKKKVSAALMGHVVSDETRKKLSKPRPHIIPWNKGKKNYIIPWNKGMAGLTAWNKGIKTGILPWNTGIEVPVEKRKHRKFTTDQEEQIKNEYLTKSVEQLAIDYNVSKTLINNIVNGTGAGRSKIKRKRKRHWTNKRS